MSLVIANHITKDYTVGQVTTQAIKDVSFAVEPGAFICIVGPSGSGKSTLLNMIGCLDHPSQGTITVLGQDVATLDRKARAEFRGQNIGFIFQDFNLIPILTAYENVEYPLLMVQAWESARRKKRVTELLEAVGMTEHAGKRPDQLSGGQKQRVAIARALVAQPKLVLADEPTANLDHATAYRIIGLMKQMRIDFGTTFIFSTHDPKIVGEAEAVLNLEDGRLTSFESKATAHTDGESSVSARGARHA